MMNGFSPTALEAAVLNFHRVLIENFVEEVKRAYYRTYSDIDAEYANILGWVARLVLENISNSDALYHNVEHTVLVTLAGQAILEGKHLTEGGVEPVDWLHYMMACLCHDIGYVKYVCKSDDGNSFATGQGDEMIEVSEGSTDIVLTPYHVSRSKLFVTERFSNPIASQGAPRINVERICDYIEMTRFPVPKDEAHADTRGLGGLVRAADFIGQLGDPHYLRKAPALYYEFVEMGNAEKFGYTNPGDMRRTYPRFYWDIVRPYIEDGLEFLQVTMEGRQWIANLHAHVFMAEHIDGH